MISSSQSRLVRVADESGVGEARRLARGLAREAELGEVATEQAAIVAAEAGRNAVLHGRGGEVVITRSPATRSIEILALDRGPGIADLGRALADGYSTAGTAGQGLGAIARIASVFDVYSLPGRGTAVLARIGGTQDGSVGGVSVAMATEAECGDAWALEQAPGGPVVLVADGLGHGHKAAEASAAAVAAFRQTAHQPVERIVETVHKALRATRGAAVAVAQGSREGPAVRYAGIGNIAGAVLGSLGIRKMVSLPGTAGHEARSIRAFDYPWPEGSLLIMHSDGITARWDLAQYPGLSERHPSLIAGILLRDFARGRDDATVAVVRRDAS